MNNFCVHCGAPLEEGQLFCGNCGKAVADAPQPSQPTPSDTPEKKNKTALILGIVISVLVVLAILCVIGMSLQSEETTPDDGAVSDTYVTDTSDKKDEDVKTASEFELGVVSGYTYENEYLGIKCTLPGWTFASREELLESTDSTLDFIASEMENEDLRAELEASSVFCDMKAIHPDGATNANIMVTNEPSILDEEATIRILAVQLPEYYKEMGMEIDACEVMEIDVNGTNKHALYYSWSLDGAVLHTLQMHCAGEKHDATITIVAASKEECLSICDSFYFN